MQQLSDKTATESEFCHDVEAVKVTPFPIRTFRFYVAKGMIPSYKFGRNRLFKKSEVVAAIEKCRVGTVDEVLQ
jgi:excisionase family DNA binding protein